VQLHNHRRVTKKAIVVDPYGNHELILARRGSTRWAWALRW
jgi:hypothetical protein